MDRLIRLLVIIPFFIGQAFSFISQINHLGAPLGPHLSEQFVTAIYTKNEVLNLSQLEPQFRSATKILVSYYIEEKKQFKTLLLFKEKDQKSAREKMENLQSIDNTGWSYPIFLFEGDPREISTNDPEYSKQLRHPIMKNELAWEVTSGISDVIVAVTDDGVQWKHADLADNIWSNHGEIPDNQIDDDQNGYVDDVRGWDFSDNDANPMPSSSGNHGTHVAGIIAAQKDNNVGVVGTAPAVKVMPLRFYGGSRRWNAALILETYKYAADNGARIITTSYNIDGYKDDPIYLSALEYAYEKGLLIFNSGGNSGYKGPRREKFERLILVASTNVKANSADTKSSFSNYGLGTDISAPGSDIYSTVNSGYQYMSGTSMAAPNAAAVAALIWSNNPSWSKEQVAAQLFASADDISAVNARYQGFLGRGRVNSNQAVRSAISPPQVHGVIELKGRTSLPRSSKTLTLHLKSLLDADTVKSENAFRLIYAGADQVFGNADDEIQYLDPKNKVYIGTNLIKFSLPALKTGKYQFIIDSSIVTDPFGQNLDGNAKGESGQDFIQNFSVN